MSGQGNQFRKPPPPKNVLDNPKLKLYAASPSDPRKKAAFTWAFVENNPRIVVWTNDPTDKELNIKGPMDLLTFGALMSMLAAVADGPNETRYAVENKNYIWPNGRRSEEPVVVSTTHFGKDKDGLVWISLSANNRPKIKFVFGENDFHHFVNQDGSPFDRAKLSVAFAKSYAHTLRTAMDHLMVNNYTEPQKKDGQGQTNAGASNNHQDDDIPF